MSMGSRSQSLRSAMFAVQNTIQRCKLALSAMECHRPPTHGLSRLNKQGQTAKCAMGIVRCGSKHHMHSVPSSRRHTFDILVQRRAIRGFVFKARRCSRFKNGVQPVLASKAECGASRSLGETSVRIELHSYCDLPNLTARADGRVCCGLIVTFLQDKGDHDLVHPSIVFDCDCGPVSCRRHVHHLKKRLRRQGWVEVSHRTRCRFCHRCCLFKTPRERHRKLEYHDRNRRGRFEGGRSIPISK